MTSVAPRAFAVAHGAERLPRAHVRDVEGAAGQLGERDVALDHDRFGRRRGSRAGRATRRRTLVRDAVAFERRVLAVIDDRHAEHPGVLERAAHQQRRRHGPAVVGEGDAAGRLLRAELGELLAARAERDRADRIDAREAGFAPPSQDQLGDARRDR